MAPEKRLLLVSKMSPDPSAVHVLGGGRVARKLPKKKYKKDTFKR